MPSIRFISSSYFNDKTLITGYIPYIKNLLNLMRQEGKNDFVCCSVSAFYAIILLSQLTSINKKQI